ncbi:hypothetical protein L208DRAFT_1388244 [Tricholoma matsutake]|nr:hypothetical protein L208DRAFT_1388244 [Tricholoma matsutake 945]
MFARPENHDSFTALCKLCIGFFTLMQLGELTWPEDKDLRDPRKLTKRSSVIINDTFLQFFLPGHKANKFFEGNTIIICPNPFPCNPMVLFKSYLRSHDHLFPLSFPSWLKVNGTVLTRSFFMHCLCLFFQKDIGGQSMRAGGATLLAENGVAPHIIQGISRWASDTWHIYIRKHPVLLQAMLHA